MTGGFPKLPNGFFQALEIARRLDPDAFKPVNLAHFTDEQITRQDKALRKAAEEQSR